MFAWPAVVVAKALPSRSGCRGWYNHSQNREKSGIGSAAADHAHGSRAVSHTTQYVYNVRGRVRLLVQGSADKGDKDCGTRAMCGCKALPLYTMSGKFQDADSYVKTRDSSVQMCNAQYQTHLRATHCKRKHWNTGLLQLACDCQRCENSAKSPQVVL